MQIQVFQMPHHLQVIRPPQTSHLTSFLSVRQRLPSQTDTLQPFLLPRTVDPPLLIRIIVLLPKAPRLLPS